MLYETSLYRIYFNNSKFCVHLTPLNFLVSIKTYSVSQLLVDKVSTCVLHIRFHNPNLLLTKILIRFIFSTALEHCWITGKQSERNIHATVSEQLKKNFAKSRWRVRNYDDFIYLLLINFLRFKTLSSELQFISLDFTGYKTLCYKLKEIQFFKNSSCTFLWLKIFS